MATESEYFAHVDEKDFPDLPVKVDGYNGDALTRFGLRLLAYCFPRTSELIEAPWTEFDLDRSRSETSDKGAAELVVPGLAAMGLHVPSPIRCLNLSEQIAQKLHACTGPYSAGRARDVFDDFGHGG